MNGRLLYGVAFEGKRLFDFRVRLLTLAGECRVIENIVEQGIEQNASSVAQQMLLDLAYLAEQVEIEGLPKAQMTAQFLLDNLTPADYDILSDALAQLRKKHIAAGENQSPNEETNSG